MLWILGLLSPFVIVVISLILYRWQYGIFFLFTWLFIGDTIRKIVPGQPPEIMLIGDALLLITYFSFFAFLVIKKKNIWSPPFLISLISFAVISIISTITPSSPGLIVGAIGLRSYLWYIPLIFLGYSLFNKKEELLRFCSVLAYSAIPLFLFALIQNVFGSIDFTIFNPFEGGHLKHSFGLVVSGDVKKTSSLFGSAQRYGMVSLFLFFLSTGLYSALKSVGRKHRLILFSVLCALGGVIISASRSAFVLLVLGIVLFLVVVNREIIQNKTTRFVRRHSVSKIILLLSTLALLLFVAYLSGSSVGLFQLVSLYDVFAERTPYFIEEMKIMLSDINLFGYGTGTMSQGLGYTSSGAELLSVRQITGAGETGIRKLMFELGVVGLILFYFFWGRLFYTIKQKLRNIKDYQMKYIGIAIAIFIFLILIRFTFIHHQVLGDFVVLIPLWLFIGILFRLGNYKELQV